MNRAHLSLLLASLLGLALSLAARTGGGLWDPVETELIARLSAGARGEGIGRPLDLFLRGGLALGAEKIRLIPAAFGLLTLLLSYGATALGSDRRAALYALIFLGCTPIFLLNSHLAIGAAPAIFAQLLSAISLHLLLERDDLPRSRTLPMALLGSVIAVALAGVLLGLMPGLVAAIASRFIEHGKPAIRDPISALALASAVALGALLTSLIIQDSAGYSLALGGSASGAPPPAFHTMIERAFHGLLPISAFIPALIAFGLRDEPAAAATRSERVFIRFMLLLAAASYLSGTLFEARYGVTTFLAAPAIAIACAMALRALERRPEGSRLIALASLLLLTLGIRDLFLFPDSLLGALPIRGESLPESETLRLLLRAAIGAPLIGFGLMATLVIGGDYVRDAERAIGDSDRQSAAQTRRSSFLSSLGRSWRGRFGLAAGGALYLAAAIAGILYVFAPGTLPFRSIIGLVASIVALAIPCLLLVGFGLYGLRQLVARAPQLRTGMLVISALPVGLCLAFIVLPALDAQLSPKGALALLEMLERDESIERSGESELKGMSAPIYAIEQNPAALTLYTDLEIDSERSLASIRRALPRERRVYLLLPSERLAEFNRELWVKARRHLFVLSDENPNTLLATNLPIEGYENLNPLASLVLAERPEIAHPAEAKLSGGYALLGYEIVSDRPALEAGRKFTLRLFWSAERRQTGSYEVFVHLDGPSGRIHGDHAPLRGLYGTGDWAPGDFLIDEREIRVPGHFAPGKYTLHVGLYRGKQRAEVLKGASDGDDRIIAGVLELR